MKVNEAKNVQIGILNPSWQVYQTGISTRTPLQESTSLTHVFNRFILTTRLQGVGLFLKQSIEKKFPVYDWLRMGTAEKPLIGWKIRCLGACSSAFRWQFAGASFENVWTFCKREHRKARIILDFCPDGTSTCRREWGLSKGKYVWNVSLVLSLSSSVIPYVIISFVGWCRFHNFRAEHGERKHLLCLFTIHLLLQILMYRWLNTMNTP